MKRQVICVILLAFSLHAYGWTTLDGGPYHYVSHNAYVGNPKGPLCWPTQYTKIGGTRLISDYRDGRFLFNAGHGWRQSPIHVGEAHTIYAAPWGGYITEDTKAGKILAIKSLESSDYVAIDKVDGQPLDRPHDILVDHDSGYVYVIDGSRRLIRFKSMHGPFEQIRFPFSAMNYARSLSKMDGHVFVVNSSRGSLIRIDDFARAKYTIIRSRKNDFDYAAGAYAYSGLVLNSVAKLGDRYYATNYFTTSYAHGKDPNTMRLISWRTWGDFESDRFEDLSELLPSGVLPYMLSISEGKLWLSYFDHEHPCHSDGVMTVTITRTP